MAMKDKNFENFAKIYNGTDYKKNNYDYEMNTKYNNYKDTL
jgi:hypothetical protein